MKEQNQSCGGCKACDFCKSTPKAEPKPIHFTLFLLPLTMLVGGFILARTLGANELIQALSAIISCIISFFPLNLIEKKHQKNIQNLIKEIVEND